MAIVKEERIGNQRLILGDCREIIGGLTFDAIVTDPPYGIGYDGQKGGKRGKTFSREYEFKGWDAAAPDVSWATDSPAIIWGGNYFGLPAAGKWLSWDKMQEFSGADFELAWTNLKGAEQGLPHVSH